MGSWIHARGQQQQKQMKGISVVLSKNSKVGHTSTEQAMARTHLRALAQQPVREILDETEPDLGQVIDTADKILRSSEVELARIARTRVHRSLIGSLEAGLALLAYRNAHPDDRDFVAWVKDSVQIPVSTAYQCLQIAQALPAMWAEHLSTGKFPKLETFTATKVLSEAKVAGLLVPRQRKKSELPRTGRSRTERPVSLPVVCTEHDAEIEHLRAELANADKTLTEVHAAWRFAATAAENFEAEVARLKTELETARAEIGQLRMPVRQQMVLEKLRDPIPKSVSARKGNSKH